MKHYFSRFLATSLLVLLPAAVSAHSFLIKMDADSGQARVMLTEKYFNGDRELDPAKLQLNHITGNGKHALSVEQTKKAKELTTAVPSVEATSVIAATMAPRYRGLEKGKPAATPENTLRIDDFAKTLIAGTAENGAVATLKSGQMLEIVPQNDPYSSSSTSLTLQVLFNGKPVETTVRAGLAQEKAKSYTTDAQGFVIIPELKLGIWLVRTKVENQQHDTKSQHYEASASLLFELSDANDSLTASTLMR